MFSCGVLEPRPRGKERAWYCKGTGLRAAAVSLRATGGELWEGAGQDEVIEEQRPQPVETKQEAAEIQVGIRHSSMCGSCISSSVLLIIGTLQGLDGVALVPCSVEEITVYM